MLKIKGKGAEKFQGALQVISKAARTSVYRSNPLPSQCRHCLSVVKKVQARKMKFQGSRNACQGHGLKLFKLKSYNAILDIRFLKKKYDRSSVPPSIEFRLYFSVSIRNKSALNNGYLTTQLAHIIRYCLCRISQIRKTSNLGKALRSNFILYIAKQ